MSAIETLKNKHATREKIVGMHIGGLIHTELPVYYKSGGAGLSIPAI